jgi:integrase
VADRPLPQERRVRRAPSAYAARLRNTLDLIIAELGDQPFALTTAPMIKRVRDDHSATPRKAHKLRQMLSRLYSWANEEGLVDGYNPAAKIKRLKVRARRSRRGPRTRSPLPRRCPLWLQTPVLLALCTGQRREDVVRMTWADYQGAFIRVRQSKTGEPLDIACHKVLRSHLSSIRTAFGGPIARNAKGKPFTANSLSQAIRRQVEAIDGFPHDRSIHGLRYAAAARLDEAGCTLDRGGCGSWTPHLSDGSPLHGSAPCFRGRNGPSGGSGMNRERTAKLLNHTGLAVLKRPDGGVVTQRTANPLPRTQRREAIRDSSHNSPSVPRIR